MRKKNVMNISLTVLVLVTCLMFLTVSVSAASDVQRFSVGSGTMGGDWRIGIGALVQLVNEKYEDKYFFSIGATGGALENVRRIKSGEYHFGISHVNTMFEAWNSVLQFEGQEPFKDMRVLLRTTDQPLAIAVLDKSPIRQLSDIEGKVLMGGSIGAGSTIICEGIFDSLGLLDTNKIEKVYFNYVQAARALRDGQIDVVMMPGAPWMSPTLQELATTVDIRLIEPTPEEVEIVVKNLPYLYGDVIPANKAPGVNGDRDRLTFFWSVFFLSHADVPAEVVYDVLTVVDEEREVLKNAVGYWETAGPSFGSLMDSGIPYHEGAVKFWRETGVEFPTEVLPPEMKN